MLMRFSISNYLSFDYKTDADGQVIPIEYDLYAGRTEQHEERVIQYHKRKVLKFSSVYGANASGKTNLIKAMEAGKQIVLGTMKEVDYKEKFCRCRKENAKKPTLFEYEFTLGDRCFAYGFTVNLQSSKVCSEWLYELEENRESVLFERLVEANQYYFDEEMFCEEEKRERFRFFIEDANRIEETLLIHEIQRRKMNDAEFMIFQRIYLWFKYQFVILYPETKMGASYRWFGSDNKKLIRILKYLDTGITDYSMRKLNENAFKEYFFNEELAEQILEEPDFGERNSLKRILNAGGILFEIEYEKGKKPQIQKLMFQHGADETSYEYGEESDGTQRLIELLDVILNDNDDNVFVIDELDRSLHPQMTIKFVETFLEFSKKKKTQLIITTHESNLMDLNILRRDEIWFAEKEKDNSTKLYPLEKFKIRYDKVVFKNYLAGRYGAVPAFKDFDYVWGQE